MSKIMFVGDIHFTGKRPASRKGDDESYRKLLLDKVQSLLDICIKYNIDNVIITGDCFHNNTGITNSFEGEIWKKLLEFKKNNIEVYSIIGNHDLQFQNASEFKGTYLYKAFITGVINHLKEITVDNVLIRGFDYLDSFTENNSDCKYSICVAHSFYENEIFGGTGNANLTDEKCKNLRYNSYVLGHDHTNYDIIAINNYKVIRPGSLTRATSKTCNIYRKVEVAVFDTNDFNWTYIEIPTIPGNEAFSERVIIQKSEDLNLEKILSNLEFSNDNNIFDFIDKDTDKAKEVLKEDYEPVIDLITKYCEAVGIFRSNL